MKTGFRVFKERVTQGVGLAGRHFTPTTNQRCTAMHKEAADFAAHLNKCLKAILELKTASEGMLGATRMTMAAPLPHQFEDTAAAASSNVKALATVGGPDFKGDVVSDLVQTTSAQLHSQVLLPIKRWSDVQQSMSARLKEVDTLRLEVDSRRHTVISLSETVDKRRATLSKGGANGKVENSLEEAVRKMQEEEAKLALVTHSFQEKELSLYNDLSALIKDTEWLRVYVNSALKLLGEALIGAAAAVGEAKPAEPPSNALAELSLGTGATAQEPGGVRTAMQAGAVLPP